MPELSLGFKRIEKTRHSMHFYNRTANNFEHLYTLTIDHDTFFLSYANCVSMIKKVCRERTAATKIYVDGFKLTEVEIDDIKKS